MNRVDELDTDEGPPNETPEDGEGRGDPLNPGRNGFRWAEEGRVVGEGSDPENDGKSC